MKNFLLIFIFFSISAAAQAPDPAFNPMTAQGAAGIHINDHVLYWQNPPGVLYNQCYFSSDSSLVANMDLSVMIKNGSPSSVFSSAALDSLNLNTRYFWRIVEYNASGNSPSPVWNFRTQASPEFSYTCYFATGFEGWQFVGPLGINNWFWYSGSGTGSGPGELVFRWDPIFLGDSYYMSPQIFAPAGLNISVSFRFYEDWWSDTVTIGCAYTLDNGNSWTSIWEIQATANVGPEIVTKEINIPGNFRLGFYYTGDSNDIDFYRIDDVEINNTTIAAYPPPLLNAAADMNVHKTILNWNSGSGNITGYKIQRKTGLPGSNNSFITIDSTDSNIFIYEDNNVAAGEIYTYRICSLSPSGYFYGNEATAYVPLIVPVELINFTAEVTGKDVTLNWKTATETNNMGFEIERMFSKDVWETAGFIEGHGTTSDEKSYFFKDNNLKSGSYNYRLKQIDLDGTYEYSQVVEVEINVPDEYNLSQNFPNPFNPVTTIQFNLPQNEYVTLKIFDVLGNEVATIASGEFNAGSHKIEFSADKLSSGIYLYRITAGKYTNVKKLQVLK
jgi:hypothetical protein